MPVFRPGPGRHSLEAAMAAVKMGDRYLQIGCSEPSLLGAIASKAGLSGHACVAVDGEDAAARARSGAERSGTLIDVEVGPLDHLPYPDESFDVIVIESLKGLMVHASAPDRSALLRETHRLLAPRGRAVVIERIARPALGGLISRQVVDPAYRESGGCAPALRAAGFSAVRVLAERNGLLFVEGLR